MKKTQHPKKSTSTIDVDLTVSLEAQIARRAHEIWQHRGCEHGNDWNDWLQAEKEVKEWHRDHFPPK